MGGRPARHSTPPVGDVQNAPVIQHAALRCVVVRALRAPTFLVPLYFLFFFEMSFYIPGHGGSPVAIYIQGQRESTNYVLLQL
jgi:hypothetical protein